MRLTLQTDYALRMLMHLAINPDRLCTIPEIAARFDISRNHLMKVAQALVAMGAVDSVRGRGGGLRLSAAGPTFSLGKIVRALESGSPLVECFPGGEDTCLISPSCRLKSVLQEAQAAFFAVLDSYNVDDLVSRNAGLRKLLETSPT